MPLVAGTALQNGHYVVDALLEEAANGALYWGTHIATGLPVYLQQLTPTARDLDATVQQCLQALAFAPQPPLPQPLQFFVDGDHGYLAMGTHLGQPWSLLGQRRSPATPKAALALVRQAANGVTWLLNQGLPTVDLSPNRLWWATTEGAEDTLILTGLAVAGGAAAPPLAHPVRGLAAFLHSLLAGQLGQIQDLDTWGESLRHQRPQLSPLILQALEAGLKAQDSGGEDLLPALDRWLQMLPDADRSLVTSAVGAIAPPATMPLAPPASSPLGTAGLGTAAKVEDPTPAGDPGRAASTDPSPEPSMAIAADTTADITADITATVTPEITPPDPSTCPTPPGVAPAPTGALVAKTQTAIVPVPKAVPPQRSSRPRLVPALALTAVVAAIAGVGAGAAWRLAPNGLPGQVRLDPNQSFPPQPDWSGDQPDAGFDRPYLPEGDLERSPIPDPRWDQSPLPVDEDPWAIDDPWAPTATPDPWDPQYADPEPDPVTRPDPVEVPTPNRPTVEDRPTAPAPEPSPTGRPDPAPAPTETETAPNPEGTAES